MNIPEPLVDVILDAIREKNRSVPNETLRSVIVDALEIGAPELIEQAADQHIASISHYACGRMDPNDPGHPLVCAWEAAEAFYEDIVGQPLNTARYLPVRPSWCCGECPEIMGGGFDCTCKNNNQCPVTVPSRARRWYFRQQGHVRRARQRLPFAQPKNS